MTPHSLVSLSALPPSQEIARRPECVERVQSISCSCESNYLYGPGCMPILQLQIRTHSVSGQCGLETHAGRCAFGHAVPEVPESHASEAVDRRSGTVHCYRDHEPETTQCFPRGRSKQQQVSASGWLATPHERRRRQELVGCACVCYEVRCHVIFDASK